MQFVTSFRYSDRVSKARYVWLKYRPILKGRILDVGADECHLKQHLPEDTEYCGIGLGGSPDRQVDLEKEGIPFPDDSFDCVLCLDVLEHLENIHALFDDLCRVTRRYLIISLPNPWSRLWHTLAGGDYRPGQALKFYGLPLERPEDRHKWFFSSEEAERFILYRAGKNGMRVVQMDYESTASEGHGWRRLVRVLARSILLRGASNVKTLYAGPIWAVLVCQKPLTE